MRSNSYKPSPFRGALILLLLLACITYLLRQRNWTDIFLYSYIAAIPVAFRFARREGRIYFEDAKTARKKIAMSAKLVLPTILFAAIFIPFGGALYGATAALVDAFYWIAATLTERGRSTTLAVVATTVAGIILFAFRLNFRCVYGVTEAAVGLLVAGHRMNNEKSVSTDVALLLALLTAGVYLVVRGLDNIHQGWKSGSDPIANWLLRRKEAVV